MATLILQSVGRVAGGQIGGAFGAVIGRELGKLAGQAIQGDAGAATEGPRLTTLHGLSATEGAPIPRVYGRARIGGQIIWATRFVETATVTRSGASGGKSTARGSKATTYSYAANFAVGLCEGPIAFVRRIWADGREIDRTGFVARVYKGDETQAPDPLIVAKEGADHAPAYRGLAYIVFENFPLADYGNRIPQLSFEVVRPVAGLCDMIRAVNIIPGASEYAYGVQAYVQSDAGVTQTENRHQLFGASDWTASLDALQALCPNLKQVALVVAWFGDSTQAGACTIAPRVESRRKTISGASWSAAGLTRDSARLVTQIDGRPAYGGTPADDVVRAALADLRARGLNVLFYPMVMMDAPGFPWRGEIAPQAADGSVGVRAEIDSFFGADGALWTYGHFLRCCARLCRDAGGVEAFLLGSELRGLTGARDDAGAFPAVERLVALAAEMRAILGAGVKISYAADWSEFSARARDNGRDLRFPLDVLWASRDVGFVGVDWYAPMSDWRPEPGHLDARLGRSPYDRAYLASQIAGGEGFDYFYADDAARAAQDRSPISDGAYGKPWVYRVKDLVSWWSQPHVERVGGVETRATAWKPRSKPIWFVEAGCPAVDLGANAPNVFPDAKRAVQTLPPFSSGARDDLIQIRALEALIAHFDPRDAAANPMSDVYGGPMLDPERIYLWSWDARPFPAFPMVAAAWSDASSWRTGHWLNGRLEAAPMDALAVALLRDLADLRIEPPPLDSIVDGFVVDRPMSARAAFAPLAAFANFDALASAGALRLAHKRDGAILDLCEEDLAPLESGALVSVTRMEEAALPRELSLVYAESEFDYRSGAVLSRRLDGAGKRSAQGELALVAHEAAARRAADVWLQDVWAGRERAQARLRPGLVGVEPGDLVTLPGAGPRLFRVERLVGAIAPVLHARAIDRAIFDAGAPAIAPRAAAAPLIPGPPRVEVLDLAIARGDPAPLQYVAAFADPWPGELALFRAASGGGFEQIAAITQPSGVGETLDPLPPGPAGRFDRVNAVRVTLRGAYLASCADADMLAGANRLALRGADGAWEIVGFAQAELVGERIWRLSRLLRGLGGEEALAQRLLPPGATVVLLDAGVTPLVADIQQIGVERRYRIGPASRDHADPAYVEFRARPGPLGLKPYAPVHARATRVADGVRIDFIRRARRDADGWETREIPLGEAGEAYHVDILAQGALRRRLAVASTSALYPAAQELADFGAPQTRLDLRIAQVSALVGDGFALETRAPIL